MRTNTVTLFVPAFDASADLAEYQYLKRYIIDDIADIHIPSFIFCLEYSRAHTVEKKYPLQTIPQLLLRKFINSRRFLSTNQPFYLFNRFIAYIFRFLSSTRFQWASSHQHPMTSFPAIDARSFESRNYLLNSICKQQQTMRLLTVNQPHKLDPDYKRFPCRNRPFSANRPGYHPPGTHPDYGPRTSGSVARTCGYSFPGPRFETPWQ